MMDGASGVTANDSVALDRARVPPALYFWLVSGSIPAGLGGDSYRRGLMQDESFAYVGSLKCGCGCAIVSADPKFMKHAGGEVAQMLADGYDVKLLARDAAVEAFSAKCANYPHEDWQRRIETSRKERSESPQSADAVRPPANQAV